MLWYHCYSSMTNICHKKLFSHYSAVEPLVLKLNSTLLTFYRSYLILKRAILFLVHLSFLVQQKYILKQILRRDYSLQECDWIIMLSSWFQAMKTLGYLTPILHSCVAYPSSGCVCVLWDYAACPGPQKSPFLPEGTLGDLIPSSWLWNQVTELSEQSSH